MPADKDECKEEGGEHSQLKERRLRSSISVSEPSSHPISILTISTKSDDATD